MTEGPEYDEPTSLHEERLEAVAEALLRRGARSVIDLGCGDGVLLAKLADTRAFERLGGIDASVDAVCAAERRLRAGVHGDAAPIVVEQASFEVADEKRSVYEAAALVETLEHVEPRRLSAVEHAVFGGRHHRIVVVTTPNSDYNPRFGMADGELRHSGHRFEWGRTRFANWARGVAGRNGYRVELSGIGPVDADLGCPTQMATFERGAASEEISAE